MRLDLPVLLTLTVVAAAVQTSLPPTAWMASKPPVLTAVAVYYALSRELPLALTAALWIGAVTDACSGLPFPVSALWLLALCGGLRYLRRFVAEGAFWRGLVVMAVAAPLQTVWYSLAVGNVGLGWDGYVLGLAGTAGCGALVGLTGFKVCGWLDGLAGNVKGAERSDGVPWHNANV